MQQPK